MRKEMWKTTNERNKFKVGWLVGWCCMLHQHHHHHIVPPARISLTLSRHFSLSFITSGRSSGLHPVSSQSCCMYVWSGRSAFAQPYVGVYRSTSLMSSSLLPQQCSACLVRLIWIVFVIGGRWPYSWCFVGCCLQTLTKRLEKKARRQLHKNAASNIERDKFHQHLWII